MNELTCPCATCCYRGEDKNRGRCKICIDEGTPLKYSQGLGGLSESLPLDVMLIGHGGTEMVEQRASVLGDEDEQIILEICREHRVPFKNVRGGSVGAAFSRARFDIIKYFIEKESDLNHLGISNIVGIHPKRVDNIVYKIRHMKEINRALLSI